MEGEEASPATSHRSSTGTMMIARAIGTSLVYSSRDKYSFDGKTRSPADSQIHHGFANSLRGRFEHSSGKNARIDFGVFAQSSAVKSQVHREWMARSVRWLSESARPTAMDDKLFAKTLFFNERSCAGIFESFDQFFSNAMHRMSV